MNGFEIYKWTLKDLTSGKGKKKFKSKICGLYQVHNRIDRGGSVH